MGPKYLPCKVMAAWRCFTMVSGFICASALPLTKATAKPAAKRLFFIGFSIGLDICKHQPKSFISLAQPRSVLGNRADLPLGQAGCHAPHCAVGVVRAPALLERLELGGDVLGILASEPRVLARQARPGGAMATGTGRHARGRVAAAPDLLSKRGEVLVGRRGRLEALRSVVGSEALHLRLRAD